MSKSEQDSSDKGSMAEYIRLLSVTDPLRKPLQEEAIQTLCFSSGSKGLDAGCGIGSQALLLAQAVGPAGHVTGFDKSSELLEYARKTVENRGMSEQISFEQGDVNHLPFDTDTFDWAWSSDCVGYAPMEPLPLINELARMVKPGGTVAVLAWSSQILLPGYPMLEARLNATNAGIAPFIQGKKPESHFFRALGWFREAGLENCSAHTFSGTVYAPLSNDIRDALTAFFPMRWENSLQELSPRDREEYFRLTEPDSPYFIINEPDYYAFFTYTMFRGQVRRAY